MKSYIVFCALFGAAVAQYPGLSGLPGGFGGSSMSLGGFGGGPMGSSPFASSVGGFGSAFGRSPYASSLSGLSGLGAGGLGASSLGGSSLYGASSALRPSSIGGAYGGFGGSSYSPYSSLGSSQLSAGSSPYASLDSSPFGAAGGSPYGAASLASPSYSEPQPFGSGLVHTVLSNLGPVGARMQASLVGANPLQNAGPQLAQATQQAIAVHDAELARRGPYPGQPAYGYGQMPLASGPLPFVQGSLFGGGSPFGQWPAQIGPGGLGSSFGSSPYTSSFYGGSLGGSSFGSSPYGSRPY